MSIIARWQPNAWQRARVLAAALALGLGLGIVANAQATTAQTTGQTPAHISASIANARLQGEGRLRYWGFHVYDAQLFASQAIARADEWQSRNLALHIVYARELKGIDIAKSSAAEIERLGAGNEAQRQRWAEKMRSFFPDVKEGDSLTAVFLQPRGVQFFFNGKPITLVEEIDFARAFFAIWLDPRSAAPRLRQSLLALD